MSTISWLVLTKTLVALLGSFQLHYLCPGNKCTVVLSMENDTVVNIGNP